MIDRPARDTEPRSADDEQILRELEQSTSQAIEAMRSSTRLAMRVPVIVEPGNASERGTRRLQGVTGDISSGGAQILLPLPIGVGDLFLVSFDRKTLDVAPVLARCVRARLVREDAFEAGLKFLTPIDLGHVAGGDAPRSVI